MEMTCLNMLNIATSNTLRHLKLNVPVSLTLCCSSYRNMRRVIVIPVLCDQLRIIIILDS